MIRKLLLPLILGIIISFASCKKEDKETTTSKLQHRWTVNTIIENDRIDGEDNIETTVAEPGDYMEFTEGGTVNLRLESTDLSIPYSVSSEDRIVLGGEPFDIRTLNKSTLVLYRKEMEDVNNFSEVTINMSR
jgi:hypothetical protein